MMVHRMSPELENVPFITLKDDREWERLRQFDGAPLAHAWQPLAVDVVRENGVVAEAPLADYVELGNHVPVFSKRAVDCLKPLLAECGELLRLECEEGELMAYNVLKLSDALDEQASRIKRFADGRIMIVEHYVLRVDRIPAYPIFKLNGLKRSDVFVREPFVQRTRECQLKGFRFDLVELS